MINVVLVIDCLVLTDLAQKVTYGEVMMGRSL